ncbi:fibrobacter succinogenes major paralogous domain-containing protein [Litoribacter alkaliphilus]|uniref:Fibrobacter succinogenes major paralogous domain-containing protein n=1 Tax=Litoribacter ruber TaxID=702568 RepID=A0AAP2CJE1_9BACT|nr:fibrobacter succinogenes major paralogous domain-containing protein [Litoribacter alkaliphilus]MBS9525272.1 fibrobacter succinogenes major paralogous domain-containing protein [Litoribacter alkaliphilus]
MSVRVLMLFGLLFSFSCVQQEEEQMGMVSFSALELDRFNGYSPNARTSSISEWQHIFNTDTEIQINGNGSSQTLNINPGDFFLPYQTQLAYGNYEYRVEQEGDQYMDYLPFVAQGNFDMGSLNYNIILQGETDYGLITVKNDMIQEVLLDGEVPFSLTEDEEFYFKYVRGGGVYRVEIQSSEDGESFEREIEVNAYSHQHFYLFQGGPSFMELLIGDFEYSENSVELGNVSNIVYDYDGNPYRTVRIGNQTWMAQNLKTETFCNGDPIENVPGGEDWIELDSPAYTYYDNDQAYNKDYGKLYNEYAITDERNVCPCGWKVPSLDDYNELFDFIGGEELFGQKLRKTGYDYWLTPNPGATDEYGFSAMPSGMFVYSSNSIELFDRRESVTPRFGFGLLREWGAYWSTTQFDMTWHDGREGTYFYVMLLNYGNNSVYTRLELDVLALAVRCIKED